MQVVEHSDRVTSIFGAWPSFHDAEVVRLVLDRTGPEGPTLEVQIHVFAATSEVDSTGHFVLKNHTLVTLRFTEVALETLEGFNHQNALFELSISEVAPGAQHDRRLRVEMPSSYGLEATFDCKRAIVADVKPYDVPA
jgi:hypothetical protein